MIERAANILSSELYKDKQHHFDLSESFKLLKDMTDDQYM